MKKLLLLLAIPVALSITGCNGSIEPSACNCGNLYTGEYNPSNIDYSADELNDGDKMHKDVDRFVELGKACAIEYGNLSDIEKELAEGSTSLSTVPNIDQAVENAKAKCN